MEKKFNIASSIVQIVVGILSLVISIYALSVSVNTYRMTMDEFSPRLEIEKDDNIINIKNKDDDIFVINSIFVEGVDAYWLQNKSDGHAINLATFSYMKNINDTDSPDLNNIKVDTASIYHRNGEDVMTQEEQRLLLSDIRTKLNNLSTMNIKTTYESTEYYIHITFYNKYTLKENSLTLRCPVKENGELERIHPCNINYRENNNFYDILRNRNRIDILIDEMVSVFN